ncbi:unnamed protein product [Commensalibacter communis]|uniref:hypothetical protein n=1 Tax=Commensalibacter communis TaxID=2972786 RepID=UPI0022FF9616|nr:hypothetical protein [Commensalibacter communis]CAI3951090.1 unnamed protein product [Commensalibacter communis]
MVRRLISSMRQHDHWFSEWWSSVLLVVVGIYGLCVPNSFIIQQSFIDGFLQFFPFDVWQWLFIVFGLFQFTALRCESIIGRGVAAFFASSLLIWGTLNILVYGQWHFSLVAWGIFAVINLYALYRIARGIEKRYELL